jgi:hypothetical protein
MPTGASAWVGLVFFFFVSSFIPPYFHIPPRFLSSSSERWKNPCTSSMYIWWRVPWGEAPYVYSFTRVVVCSIFSAKDMVVSIGPCNQFPDHLRAIFFFWVLCSFVRHVCSSSYLNIVRFLRFTRNLSVQILFSRSCRDVYQDDKYIHAYICNIFMQVTRAIQEEIGFFYY